MKTDLKQRKCVVQNGVVKLHSVDSSENIIVDPVSAQRHTHVWDGYVFPSNERNQPESLEKGNRVKVEFTSESATQFSGDEIKGFGVVDRCEDGYVFGRLESGKPFMCLESDCELVIKPNLDYEHWFMNQEFYTNMRFIHGDNLFSKDGDVYRVLPVQMAYQVWISRNESLNNMEQCYIQIKKERDEQQNHALKLKEQLIKLGYTDQSGELMKPPLGDQPRFDLLESLKSERDHLKKCVDGAFDIALNTNIFLPANSLYSVLERIKRALRGES